MAHRTSVVIAVCYTRTHKITSNIFTTVFFLCFSLLLWGEKGAPKCRLLRAVCDGDMGHSPVGRLQSIPAFGAGNNDGKTWAGSSDRLIKNVKCSPIRRWTKWPWNHAQLDKSGHDLIMYELFSNLCFYFVEFCKRDVYPFVKPFEEHREGESELFLLNLFSLYTTSRSILLLVLQHNCIAFLVVTI